jgi:DNA-directed RNA polymerase specialized sigma subunit
VLQDFAREHAERLDALERQKAELQGERDEAIRLAKRGGMTIEQIAEVLELSHQRISQIVNS